MCPARKVIKCTKNAKDVHSCTQLHAAESKSSFATERSRVQKRVPCVVFLGTGSSIPSKYRNVSSILLHTRYRLLIFAGNTVWLPFISSFQKWKNSVGSCYSILGDRFQKYGCSWKFVECSSSAVISLSFNETYRMRPLLLQPNFSCAPRLRRRNLWPNCQSFWWRGSRCCYSPVENDFYFTPTCWSSLGMKSFQ